jgi:tetratricopeptide (TPR) repeat protein
MFKGVEGSPEVLACLSADPNGNVEATWGGSGLTADAAATTAAAVTELTAAGSVLGLTRLELLLVKGERSSTATAVRPGALLVVLVDPTKATTQLEKTLHAWTPQRQGPAATTARPRPSSSSLPPPLSSSSLPLPTPPRPIQAPPPAKAGAPADPWSALRRALVRGQLTEATARRRELSEPRPGAPRPGAEPLPPAELERAMQVLLEGVGSVIAGDGIGGARILKELLDPAQPNLSFRWLALHWSARAALKSGSFSAARAHVKEALAVARQLDLESQALTQWIAGESLSNDADPARALAWLSQSRTRFEGLGDAWGMAQTWLATARVLGGVQRSDEAAAAARQARVIDPNWDEPAVFLACQALAANDLAEADGILLPLKTPAADRIRALIVAIQQGGVSPGDAGEFLRLRDAAPSPQAIRALERIANSSPRLVEAREALAWMLLKIGRYADAGTLFRGLLAQDLAQSVRASVTLGLGCIAHAQQAGGGRDAALRTVVDGVGAGVPAATGAQPPPVPRLGSSVMSATPAPGAGVDAVFSGQMSDMPLPDLLEFLRSAKRTGLLVCSSAAGMAALRLREGLITEGASPGTPNVGELLLRARNVTPLALSTVTEKDGAKTDQVLGEALVRGGLVEAAAVQEAFRQQIQLTVLELVRWKTGAFAFKRDDAGAPPPTGTSVALDPRAVLLNVFKTMDEAVRDATATEAKA